MCGICGLISAERGSGPDRELLERMRLRLAHRGPDSHGSFVEGRVALAARRLSIIDLEHGDQPISNEDGTVTVVQNGEIYNFAELRRGLERSGHEFRTGSDTEVLVHLYEERGPEFVAELRGMFAIAVWASAAAGLVLAGDRFGIKPLYYRRDGEGLAFAAELKSLLEDPGFSREIDPRALAAYLAFNSIPTPLTIFSEARKLEAGGLLVWADGGISVSRHAPPRPAGPRGPPHSPR